MREVIIHSPSKFTTAFFEQAMLLPGEKKAVTSLSMNYSLFAQKFFV
jgi:hypothetical protein